MTELPWEDNLLERKSESDLKDLLKTVVAFANSVRPGHVATILIGELNDGTVQGVRNPDSIQKTVRKECDKVYPTIIWRSAVYDNEGKYCVRVEIESSGEAPHFAGPAWIRRGSETVKASNELFQKLVDLRSSKVFYLTEWVGKAVTVSVDPLTFRTRSQFGVRPSWKVLREEPVITLLSVNQFFVTFEAKNETLSEPLSKLTLSWDDKYSRLALLLKDE